MTQNLQIQQLNENVYADQVYKDCEMSRILGGVNNVASFAYFYRNNANLIDLMRTYLILDMYESKGISGEMADLGKSVILKTVQFFEKCHQEFENNKAEQELRDKST